jgi:hypothetical protein
VVTGGAVNPEGTPTDETVEKWFYDLGLVAERVEQNHAEALANRARTRRLAKQARAIALFTVLAMVVLGYRSEVNADRISRNADVSQQRLDRSARQECLAGQRIIDAYNALQDELSAIDRETPGLPPQVVDRRVAARDRYRLTPPECPR